MSAMVRCPQAMLPVLAEAGFILKTQIIVTTIIYIIHNGLKNLLRQILRSITLERGLFGLTVLTGVMITIQAEVVLFM